MNKTILSLLMLLAVNTLKAKQYSPEDFVYPLEGVAKLYSANFGELRSDHFHSGIDIKTDGVEGKKVVAVADGYVSRVSMSPYGYGLALYVTHPNGTTSVYGHLSRFRGDIADFVEKERYRRKSSSVNLYCTSKQFAVNQGDLIAYSGNSGSSMGPHLHFEIRESANQEPVNIVAKGIIKPKDTIAPLILRVHYIEIDTVQGIVRMQNPRSYDVQKSGATYSIAGDGDIFVGRKGYFVAEVSDRRNDVYNTFGIYKLTALIDNDKYFEYVMNKFSFSTTRYCNTIGYYPIMIKSRNETLCLAASENSDLSHYTTLVDRGIVRTVAGEMRAVRFEVEDDCGNRSSLDFNIIGKPDDQIFVADTVQEDRIVRVGKDYSYRGEGVAISIPAKSLYNSEVFSVEKLSVADSTHLSPTYAVMNSSIPLHKPITVSVEADVPFELQSKVGLVWVGRTNRPVFIGGEYRYRSVTATSRSLGKFYVACDTKAPTIEVGISNGSQQKGSSYFTCKIVDNLSGVAKYSATLDGEWIAFNSVRGRLRHNFRERPNGTKHTLVITATDAVGNTTTVTRTFTR